MKRTVLALVENDQGQFALLQKGDGGWTLPSCTLDVGGAFAGSVQLHNAGLSVQPQAHLGIDHVGAEGDIYYLCQAKSGKLTTGPSYLGAHWLSAHDVLKTTASQPLFRPVADYLLRISSLREMV